MDASCQCGRVSFKTPLPKPLALYICHCEECRRQSSSAFGCSAIFPMFPLPCKEDLSVYSRPTASGHMLNCYFCRTCGTRVIHSTPGKDVVSVKGGCIDGLDWSKARHIWTRSAMVPIPEGVEQDEEEPGNETFGDAAQSDGGGSSRNSAQESSRASAPNISRNSAQTGTSTKRLPKLEEKLERVSLRKGEDDDEIRG